MPSHRFAQRTILALYFNIDMRYGAGIPIVQGGTASASAKQKENKHLNDTRKLCFPIIAR